MSTISARRVIDEARSKHPLIADTPIPEGAILNVLSSRQKTLLLKWGGSIDGLVDTTVQLAVQRNGVLVGWDGVAPQFGTTYADGWPVQLTADNVPFVDFTALAIAGDPFGEHGGTPGFPLPDDFIRLVVATCVLFDQTIIALDVIPARERLAKTRRAVPTAFVSGNRLVPVRPLAQNNSGDIWDSNITAIQLDYLAAPVLSSLDDSLVLPAVLHEALIAGLTDYMAQSTPAMPPAQKIAFAQAAANIEQSIGDDSVDVYGSASTHSVRYRG